MIHQGATKIREKCPSACDLEFDLGRNQGEVGCVGNTKEGVVGGNERMGAHGQPDGPTPAGNKSSNAAAVSNLVEEHLKTHLLLKTLRRKESCLFHRNTKIFLFTVEEKSSEHNV